MKSRTECLNERTSKRERAHTRTMEVKSKWPTGPSGGSTSLAMDREHRRLFSAGRNPQMLVVMDADNGKIIQSFPITGGTDAAAYDPETKLIFVAMREGNIHVFHEDSPDKYSVVDTVKTQVGAKTMGLDIETHKLYLDTSDFGPAPVPTADRPRPQPAAVLGTFHVLVYGRRGSVTRNQYLSRVDSTACGSLRGGVFGTQVKAT